MAKPTPEAELDAFIAKAPANQYTFDSEKDSPRSEICRILGKNSKECMVLQMNSKKLFKAMQDYGFFCALPLDPARTHMECTPIPK